MTPCGATVALAPCRRWAAASDEWTALDKTRLITGSGAADFRLQGWAFPTDTNTGVLYLWGVLMYECEEVSV